MSNQIFNTTASTQINSVSNEEDKNSHPFYLETFKLEKEEATAIRSVFLKMEEAKLKKYENEHTTRIDLSNKLLVLTVMWLLFILLIVVGCAKGDIYLSDAVIITLITTSTVEVLGFMYLVLKYMFNIESSSKDKEMGFK